ncbi:MAG TPA: DMT family transporter [Steroidobacteraceae bacterium]|nr:DMT family transporter [Steroidobacteraceae bacterium]
MAGDAWRAAGQRQGDPQALPRADLEHRRRRAGAGEHVHLTSSSRYNLRGSLLMVAAMAGFALEDVLLKQLAATLPIGQMLALVGVGGGLVFSFIATLGGRSVLSPALLTRPVMLRNLSEAVGSAAFVTALALTTLSSAAAILQATPLAVTLGAALFLGESVGWRRWSAIGVGLAGVLLIIQPGMAGFTPASLFAVVAVIMLGLRDLCSRAVPPQVTSLQLAAWGFFSLVPAGLAMMLALRTSPVSLATPDAVRLGAVLVVGCLGYYALVAATRTGEVSAVVPFRYTRLVFALLLGYVVFGERPDALTLGGAALIVGTGLYTIWRSALRSQQQAP